MALDHSSRSTPLEPVPAPDGLWPPQVRCTPRGAATWLRRHVRTLVVGDLAAVVLGAAAAWLVGIPAPLDAWALAVLLALPALWVGFLLAVRAYEPRLLGVGSEEAQRVLRAAASVLAVVGTTSWALDLDTAHGSALVALPLATVLTLAWRCAARQHLRARRARGECLRTVVLAGPEAGVLALAASLSRSRHHGLAVTGVCLPRPAGAAGPELRPPSAALAALGLPVLGHLGEVAQVVRREDVDVVVVVPAELLLAPPPPG